MKGKVIKIKVVGESYRNGFRENGYCVAWLSDGGSCFVPGSEFAGLGEALDYIVKEGYDVEEVRAGLDRWVKEG
jgi:hypothetical protein